MHMHHTLLNVCGHHCERACVCQNLFKNLGWNSSCRCHQTLANVRWLYFWCYDSPGNSHNIANATTTPPTTTPMITNNTSKLPCCLRVLLFLLLDDGHVLIEFAFELVRELSIMSLLPRIFRLPSLLLVLMRLLLLLLRTLMICKVSKVCHKI